MKDSSWDVSGTPPTVASGPVSTGAGNGAGRHDLDGLDHPHQRHRHGRVFDRFDRLEAARLDERVQGRDVVRPLPLPAATVDHVLGGTVLISFALVGALAGKAPSTSQPPDAGLAEFRVGAATVCTDIVNGRSFEAWDTAEAAAIDLLTFAVDPPTDQPQPTEDQLDAWVAAFEPRLDDLTDARERLAELQDDADAVSQSVGLAWSQVVIAGDDLIAALSARLDGLNGDRLWADVASSVSPLPTPTVPVDALATLGMFLRDCEHVYTHQGVPEDSREFVTSAATACATVATRRTATGFFDDEAVLFDAGYMLVDGGTIETSDELIDAIDQRVAEHTTTVGDLAAVPIDDVPDAAAWQTRLDFEQALVDYWTDVASALASEDPAAIAAAIQTVIGVSIDPDPLVALFLNQRDCQLLYAASDPVPGGGMAPAATSS